MDYTINVIWVIIAAGGFILSIVGIIAKSSRESERFDSWLKTHEKELNDIRRKSEIMDANNSRLHELIQQQNASFMIETRRLEGMMVKVEISMAQINTKLGFLLEQSSMKIKEDNKDEK